MLAAGAYLQARRKMAGLTQEEVARALGVSSKAISDWETGKYDPSSETMARLLLLIHANAEDVMRLLAEPNATREDGQRVAKRRADAQPDNAAAARDQLDAAIDLARQLNTALEEGTEEAQQIAAAVPLESLEDIVSAIRRLQNEVEQLKQRHAMAPVALEQHESARITSVSRIEDHPASAPKPHSADT
jgi:transcriptional regulator with XRE-family HTH domain